MRELKTLQNNSCCFKLYIVVKTFINLFLENVISSLKLFEKKKLFNQSVKLKYASYFLYMKKEGYKLKKLTFI